MEEGFIFKFRWADAIKNLPCEIRCEIYDAAIEYAKTGRIGTLKTKAEVAFGFIKSEIDEQLSKKSDNSIEEKLKKKHISQVRREAAYKRWSR